MTSKTENHYQPMGRNTKQAQRGEDKRARAKKRHKLGFRTREGLEDWQRWNVSQSAGKFEGSEKKKIRGKEKENKEKFLPQYNSQRTVIETAYK